MPSHPHFYHVERMYSSPDIDRGIKSRRMRWAGLEACMDTQEVYTNFGWKSSREESTWKII
jgi:hypothetical protein